MKKNILVTGGAGFIGTKLLNSLVEQDVICIAGETHAIGQIHLFDIFLPEERLERVTYHALPLSESPELASLVAEIQPDVVFHLAAVVSSAAEQDFDLGMQVNFDGTRALLETCRSLAHVPRFIFASSVAVFGAVNGDVEDETPAAPLSSYGATKVLGEVLVNEYSRRNFIDGISLRLPTITVRPGRPNKAASSFVSGIVREPLSGQRTVCPVGAALPLWVMSPRQIIRNLLQAVTVSGLEVGDNRVVNLPGITVTVQQMVDALANAGGDVTLIDWEPDESIERIVGSWPGHMTTPKSLALGFVADADINSIVRAYIEDELDLDA